MPDKLCSNVTAIVVTYNPDEATLLSNLSALLSQTKIVIVVDNGSSSDTQKIIQSIGSERVKSIHLLALEHNYGLGKAYNAGIKMARSLEATFVLLMDQDSISEPGMVSLLRSTYYKLIKQEKHVGAVGARYRNSVSAKPSGFVRVTRFRFSRFACKEKETFVRADFLISSGSLIPLKVLDHVGGMDSDLFIDHVDTEWCFRAQSKGFEIYGVCGAVMLHSLGDRQTRIWWGRRRTISFHQPFRYYYMFRNSVLLWHRPYMPQKWKRADKLRLLYFLFFFSIFSPNRGTNFRMMLKGLIDGFKGKTGKLKKIK